MARNISVYLTDRSKAVLLMVSVSVLSSPSMCLSDIKVGLGSCVAIFWERAAHSVNRMMSLYLYRLVTLVLNAPVPGHHFTVPAYNPLFSFAS